MFRCKVFYVSVKELMWSWMLLIKQFLWNEWWYFYTVGSVRIIILVTHWCFFFSPLEFSRPHCRCPLWHSRLSSSSVASSFAQSVFFWLPRVASHWTQCSKNLSDSPRTFFWITRLLEKLEKRNYFAAPIQGFSLPTRTSCIHICM